MNTVTKNTNIYSFFTKSSLDIASHERIQHKHVILNNALSFYFEHPDVFIDHFSKNFYVPNIINTVNWNKGDWDSIVLNAYHYLTADIESQQRYVYNILEFTEMFNLHTSTIESLFFEEPAVFSSDQEMKYSPFSYINHEYENTEKVFRHLLCQPKYFHWNPNMASKLYQESGLADSMERLLQIALKQYPVENWPENLVEYALNEMLKLKDAKSCSSVENEKLEKLVFFLSRVNVRSVDLQNQLLAEGILVSTRPSDFKDKWDSLQPYDMLGYLHYVEQEDVLDCLKRMEGSNWFTYGLLSLLESKKLDMSVYSEYHNEIHNFALSVNPDLVNLGEREYLYFAYKNLFPCYTEEEQSKYISRLNKYLSSKVGFTTEDLTLSMASELLLNLD
jgi:hypothetical protein